MSAVDVARFESIGVVRDEFFVQEPVMIPAYDHLVEMRQRVDPVQLSLELCKGAFIGQVPRVQENIAIGDSRRGYYCACRRCRPALLNPWHRLPDWPLLLMNALAVLMQCPADAHRAGQR